MIRKLGLLFLLFALGDMASCAVLANGAEAALQKKVRDIRDEVATTEEDILELYMYTSPEHILSIMNEVKKDIDQKEKTILELLRDPVFSPSMRTEVDGLIHKIKQFKDDIAVQGRINDMDVRLDTLYTDTSPLTMDLILTLSDEITSLKQSVNVEIVPPDKAVQRLWWGLHALITDFEILNVLKNVSIKVEELQKKNIDDVASEDVDVLMQKLRDLGLTKLHPLFERRKLIARSVNALIKTYKKSRMIERLKEIEALQELPSDKKMVNHYERLLIEADDLGFYDSEEYLAAQANLNRLTMPLYMRPFKKIWQSKAPRKTIIDNILKRSRDSFDASLFQVESAKTLLRQLLPLIEIYSTLDMELKKPLQSRNVSLIRDTFQTFKARMGSLDNALKNIPANLANEFGRPGVEEGFKGFRIRIEQFLKTKSAQEVTPELEECPICQESLSTDANQNFKLPCGHIFHATHILRSRIKYGPSCPLDRQTFSDKDVWHSLVTRFNVSRHELNALIDESYKLGNLEVEIRGRKDSLNRQIEAWRRDGVLVLHQDHIENVRLSIRNAEQTLKAEREAFESKLTALGIEK